MSFHTPMRLPNIAALLTVGALLSSCTKAPVATGPSDADLQKLQTDLSALQSERKLLEEEYTRKFNEVIEKNKQSEDAKEELRKSLEHSQDEMDKLKKEFEDYKAKYRVSVRSKAVGRAYATISTTDAKTYSEAIVTGLTPVTLSIKHRDGLAKVALAKLQPALATEMGYDEMDAKRWEYEQLPPEVKAEQAEKATAEAVTKQKVADPKLAAMLTAHPDAGNPFAIQRLQNRISQRLTQLEDIRKEAGEVKRVYGSTSLGRLRMTVLQDRNKRVSEEIAQLTAMLHGMLHPNG